MSKNWEIDYIKEGIADTDKQIKALDFLAKTLQGRLVGITAAPDYDESEKEYIIIQKAINALNDVYEQILVPEQNEQLAELQQAKIKKISKKDEIIANNAYKKFVATVDKKTISSSNNNMIK